MRRLSIASTFVIWLSGASLQTSATEPLPTGGINLSPYAYWEQSFPLIDVAKMDHIWRSTDGIVFSDDRVIQLDEWGYPAVLEPGQIARALIFTHNGRKYPTGLYRLSWEGTGEVVLNDVGMELGATGGTTRARKPYTTWCRRQVRASTWTSMLRIQMIRCGTSR